MCSDAAEAEVVTVVLVVVLVADVVVVVLLSVSVVGMLRCQVLPWTYTQSVCSTCHFANIAGKFNSSDYDDLRISFAKISLHNGSFLDDELKVVKV